MKKDFVRSVLIALMIFVVGFEVMGPAQAPQDPQYSRMWGALGEKDGDFNGPEGLSISVSGEIYVADTNNHRVQVFNLDGEFLRTWGTFCDISEVENCQDPEGNGELFGPEGIAVDSGSGLVYVTDSSNNRIQVFDLDGNFIGKWGSLGSAEGELFFPIGIAVDDDGAVYVADLLNHRIQVFSGDGTFLRAWGVQGSEAGQLNFPVDIAVVGSNVYVVENANNRVQQFDLQGNSIRSWGSSCDLATSEGCELANGAGQFRRPAAIAGDSSGNIYVVDQGNHRVQAFTADGEYIAQFGSVCTLNGSQEIPAGTGCQSADGEGQFYFPKGIDLGPNGEIVVADSDNHRVQIFE